MTDKRFVQRISKIYIDKYTKLGYNPAGEYAERIIGENKELEQSIRDCVFELMRKGKHGGGTDGPQNPRPA